jgi:hypothetical protein
MSDILVYTFFGRRKRTSELLYKFDDSQYKIDKYFVPGRFLTSKLLKKVQEYRYVIGIADHNKNATKSRVDVKFTNRYGKRLLIESGPEYNHSNLNLELPSTFYQFSSTTNGPCNRSAYLIMDKILREELATKFGFFHLRRMTTEEDFSKIIKCIRDLQDTL